MRAGISQVRGLHHRRKRRFYRALGIGEEGRDAGQRLVLLGVENMQDRADQQRVTGLLPMVPLLQAPFRIDENVGDVLHVANLPFAAADFQKRVVG